MAQHVGVDHRRRDVAVAQQILDRANIVSALEQVRGEGVAEAVTGHAFVDSRRPGRIRDGSLYDGLVQVMSPFASLLVAPSPSRSSTSARWPPAGRLGDAPILPVAVSEVCTHLGCPRQEEPGSTPAPARNYVLSSTSVPTR